MLYDGIDHVILPVADLDVAAEPFERLGLRLAPTRRFANGLANRVLFVGGSENLFGVDLFSVVDPGEAARSAFGRHVLEAAERSPGLSTVALRVSDIQAAVRDLAEKGLSATAEPFVAADGTPIGDVAVVESQPDIATRLILVQNGLSQRERHAMRSRQELLDHAIPLRRLDHLAAVAPDLERSTRYWAEVLGVPLAGEVRNATTIVRQLRIGDAMFELIGPVSPDSPVASRPAGLSSMCSFEVPDLEDAVARARASGFTATDPATGTLPGTRTARISADQLSGLTLQLLEYV